MSNRDDFSQQNVKILSVYINHIVHSTLCYYVPLVRLIFINLILVYVHLTKLLYCSQISTVFTA